MAETRAHKNRKLRQDNLREWLSEKCTAQHLVDNINKIEDLDPCDEQFNNKLSKYKTANEQRIKVMNKYLPDLKTTEIIGDADNPLETNWKVEFINAPSQG